MSLSTFVDNDNGYLQWIKDHQDGYVLNVDRSVWEGKRGGTLLSFHIHKAHNHCVTRLRKGQEHWTKEFIKVCSLDVRDLENWFTQKVGEQAKICGNCFRSVVK